MKIEDLKFFSGDNKVCPWWLCFTFDNPVRKLLQNPRKILSPYIETGDRILDIGPGMGFFTFPLSQLTGATGRVVALDIQAGMLRRLGKKIHKKGVTNIETKLYDGNSFPLNDTFDFILLFWMYHEVNNKEVFIKDIRSVTGENTRILIAEPKIHVNKNSFRNSLKLFTDEGFTVIDEPLIALSRSVVLRI